MFGYSRIKYEVFAFSKKTPQKIEPKIEVDTKLLRLSEVTAQQWQQLQELQGRFAVLYLKWRYGSSDTHILLTFAKEKLVYVEWVVPAKKIRARYPFVTEKSYLIISCLTSPDFRGRGIYPAQLQNVVQSDIQTQIYWGLAARDNIPSLKGIQRAGGMKMGVFIQRKWLWGCISRPEYFPEGSDTE